MATNTITPWAFPVLVQEARVVEVAARVPAGAPGREPVLLRALGREAPGSASGPGWAMAMVMATSGCPRRRWGVGSRPVCSDLPRRWS